MKIKVKTGATPIIGQRAYLFKNTVGEYRVSTVHKYSSEWIGRFCSGKDSEGVVEVELKSNTYEVQLSDGSMCDLTVGTQYNEIYGK